MGNALRGGLSQKGILKLHARPASPQKPPSVRQPGRRRWDAETTQIALLLVIRLPFRVVRISPRGYRPRISPGAAIRDQRDQNRTSSRIDLITCKTESQNSGLGSGEGISITSFPTLHEVGTIAGPLFKGGRPHRRSPLILARLAVIRWTKS
jgi:hypothetical protein